MASWNFWNLTKTFKTTIEVPEPTGDTVLTLPSGSQRLAGINDLQPNYRNRIINGANNVNQINGTTAVTPTANGYISDQISLWSAIGSKLTCQQVLDAPIGFKYSTKITVASQYAPLTSNYFYLEFPIEGQNIIDFSLGTASASTINVSMWVKSSIAGTYSVSLGNHSGNVYVGTVTVTTVWTKVSITLVGQTSGIWLTDNTKALSLRFDLGSDVAYSTTTPLTWETGTYKTRTEDSVTFVNQVAGSTLNITGVQLEKVPTGATQGTEYEWLSYDEELRRCQRYYEKGIIYWDGLSTVGSNYSCMVYYKSQKRVIPTVILANVSALSMNATPNISANQLDNISVYHAASATAAGNFRDTYTASAQL